MTVHDARQWNIRVDVFGDAGIVVRVTVDTKPLQPNLECSAPDRALDYVEAALVDFRRGDSVNVILCTPGAKGPFYVVGNKDVAMNWLAPALIEAWHAALQVP